MTRLFLALTVLVGIFGFNPPAQAASPPPAFDAQSQASTFDATVLGWDHTVQGGCANNILYIAFGFYNANFTTLTSVTVEGSASGVEEVDTLVTGVGQERLYTYMKAGVGTGVKAIEIEVSGNNATLIGSARSYCDVDQTTPLGTPATNIDDDSFTVSVDVPSATGELAIDSALVVSLPTTVSVGADQAERTNYADQPFENIFRLVESEQAGGASVPMTWDLDPNRSYLSIGVSLKAVSEAGATKGRVVVIE